MVRENNEKNIRKITFACIAVLILVLLSAGIYYKYYSDRQAYLGVVTQIREMLGHERTIIHAAGAISGEDGALYTYTNSIDSLKQTYETGNRIIELDFMMSSDGRMICAHDSEQWAGGIDSDVPLTRDEFLDRKVYGLFATMDLDMLADYMRDHDDLYIVTDVQNNMNIDGCRLIADTYPDLMDRFIVQIYHPYEYKPIRKMGYNSIIYTLYNCTEDELNPDTLVSDINSMDLVALTFWDDWLYNEELCERLKTTHVPMCVHTVDDPDRILYDLDDAGITAVYTDNIDNDWLR